MFDYEFISELLQSLLLAVLVPLAGFAVQALIAWGKDKRAELDQKNQWMLDSAIRIAVFAAQQVYGATNGAEKKAYALDIAEKWLASKNIYMDLDVLDAAIEAAVFEQLKRWEETEPPLPETAG
jgi:hypothetical protein